MTCCDWQWRFDANFGRNKFVFLSGKPRTYDFYPPSRISNAALSGSAAMFFSYQTTTPLTSYTNWSFVNASGSTAEYPRDSDAWTFFSQFALYFAFNSLNLYGNYSITLYNSYGSTTEIFQLLPPGRSNRI